MRAAHLLSTRPTLADGMGPGGRDLTATVRGASDTTTPPLHAAGSADAEAIQRCITALGKAVRTTQAYPATSRLSIGAFEAVRAALLGLSGRDRLSFRVTPASLVVDGSPAGEVSPIEAAFARQLHQARVGSVEINCQVPLRELSCFCLGLATARQAARDTAPLVDLLADQGVSSITVQMRRRPAFLGAGPSAAPVATLSPPDPSDAEPGDGPTRYLYPPDAGWVRVDPSVTRRSVSLGDLAQLIDNPPELASALSRLAGDETAAADPQAALVERLPDIVQLFRQADARQSTELFARLSRAVLGLDRTRRTALLRRTILPGLLDGVVDRDVLSAFPDVDLAESLCLLLDLETASPQLVDTALERLALPPDRLKDLQARIAVHVQQRRVPPTADGHGHDHAIEQNAKKLIELDPTRRRGFEEFASFDLTVTDETRRQLGQLVHQTETSDDTDLQLDSLYYLLHLERRPEAAAVHAESVRALLNIVDASRSGLTATRQSARFAQLAVTLRRERPEVARAIELELQDFCKSRLITLANQIQTVPDALTSARSIIEAFGESASHSVLDALDNPGGEAAWMLLPLFCERASALAPALVAALPTARPTARRAIARVLGYAGSAGGPALAGLLKQPDGNTRDEALAALVRIGSTTAAAAVSAYLEHADMASRPAAEDALLKFPRPQWIAQLTRLLGSKVFVADHPEAVIRLLDRMTAEDARDLHAVLTPLAARRFHLWKPACARLARKAHALVAA